MSDLQRSVLWGLAMLVALLAGFAGAVWLYQWADADLSEPIGAPSTLVSVTTTEGVTTTLGPVTTIETTTTVAETTTTEEPTTTTTIVTTSTTVDADVLGFRDDLRVYDDWLADRWSGMPDEYVIDKAESFCILADQALTFGAFPSDDWAEGLLQMWADEPIDLAYGLWFDQLTVYDHVSKMMLERWCFDDYERLFNADD